MYQADGNVHLTAYLASYIGLGVADATDSGDHHREMLGKVHRDSRKISVFKGGDLYERLC